MHIGWVDTESKISTSNWLKQGDLMEVKKCWNIKFIVGIVTIFLLNSCRDVDNSNRIREGVIEYDIIYLENNLDIATPLLPKKMTLTFNNRYSLTSIEGFLGFFSIKLLSDMKEGKETTLVKIFDNHYVHYGNKGETSSIFQYMEITRIKPDTLERTIAGVKTKSVMVIEDPKKDTFQVFYSENLGCASPNKNNPYQNIEGVMLQFHLQLNQIRMRLEAKNIIEKNIPHSSFDIPEGYKPISKENMTFLIDKIMKEER